MSIYKKPSKWKAGYFPTERVLAIAATGSFTVHRYSYGDEGKNIKAKKLVKEGYLKYEGIEGSFRNYSITPLGKVKLKELQSI